MYTVTLSWEAMLLAPEAESWRQLECFSLEFPGLRHFTSSLKKKFLLIMKFQTCIRVVRTVSRHWSLSPVMGASYCQPRVRFPSAIPCLSPPLDFLQENLPQLGRMMGLLRKESQSHDHI